MGIRNWLRLTLNARLSWLGGYEAGHPGAALATNKEGEAQEHIAFRFKCPACGKAGAKEIVGHAQVLRRLVSGKGVAYDVYAVWCSCKKVSSLWFDCSSWCPMHVQGAELLCRPNGKCVFVLGSGQMPYIDPSLLDKKFR